MNKISKVLLKISLVMFLVTISLLTYAPPLPPAGGGPPCWPPPCIPIDGGIGVLLAAGALFGIKKGLEMSKKA
ncbi:MAG: hypothetical protein MRY83_13405 [Flavobacteriales bacterium]|nr:hypothetical protein [Flavobacteriales bacterium]